MRDGSYRCAALLRLLRLHSYVEMLLQQQYCMVKELQALYKELQACNGRRAPDPMEPMENLTYTIY